MSTGEQAWMGEATCARVDLPWSADSARVPPVLVLLMMEACTQCPVRQECAEYVDANGINGGWWAGEDRGRDNVAGGECGEPVRFGEVIADEVEVPAFLAHYLTRPYPCGGDAA